jgi:hypothetical protein
MKLIQFTTGQNENRVGVCQENEVQLLKNLESTYALFMFAEDEGITIREAATRLLSGEYIDFQTLVDEKRLKVPLNHPDPYHTWITGTGLTHLGSASSRNAMHEKPATAQDATDSIKMFRMGIENGKMKDSTPGVQPEWFYKGNGLTAVAPGHAIPSPAFALDGGEEPEIAALYIINKKGEPKRMGYALGNEFSDHKMEKINYLYLAHSKLRFCSYGPELLVGDLPANITGKSRIRRQGNIIWEKNFLTGEANMSHNIYNLEYHHFKYELFRQPGDVHVHFFGTSVLSFSDNIETEEGDSFEIEADAFQHPLINSYYIK